MRVGCRHAARAAVPSRFAPSSAEMKPTPVTLPPGRLRLATRPSLTGSPPVANTIGIVVVAALAASAASVFADDHGDPPANQLGHQRRQPVGLIFRPAVFDRDVLALDEACFLQALAERGHAVRRSRRAIALRRNPITGIAGCCAPRRERPRRRRAAEQRDELAPFSFDHLVGAGEQRRRHVEAESLSGFEVDYQFKPRRLNHRKIGWVCSV